MLSVVLNNLYCFDRDIYLKKDSPFTARNIILRYFLISLNNFLLLRILMLACDSFSFSVFVFRSVCPQLCGMYLVKLAMLLTLLGGVATQENSGVKRRSQSHLLLVGDPGTGESLIMYTILTDLNCIFNFLNMICW